jgi:2-dehydropantoate 2-reductase
MRILVIGAGAIGGYFGGRLLQAGRDVTFLVRHGRAAELAATGLTIKSPKGDATLRSPPTVLAEELHEPYDLILLSCKAYDLDGAVASFAPAVGRPTAILPLLNGMRHLDVLDARFGRDRVLGGECLISATLDEHRAIVHLSGNHEVAFGERDGATSDRVRAIAAAMTGVAFEARASEHILQEMWEKWVFLGRVRERDLPDARSDRGHRASPGRKRYRARPARRNETDRGGQRVSAAASIPGALAGSPDGRRLSAHGFHAARYGAACSHRSGSHCRRHHRPRRAARRITHGHAAFADSLCRHEGL